MTKQEIADLLGKYNRWRRGEDIEQPDPAEIGEALDLAIAYLREKD